MRVLLTGKDKYSETVKARPERTNTLVFTDSIPKGIHMNDVNNYLKTEKLKC